MKSIANNSKNSICEIETYKREVCILQFPMEWEKNIMLLISSRQKKKRQKLIQILFEEVKELYIQDMKNINRHIIAIHKIYQKNSVPIVRYDCLMSVNFDSTKQFKNKENLNYSQFLICSNLLQKNYLLSNDAISSIIKLAYFNLPSILCNFEMYRLCGIIKLTKLQNMVSKDIQKNALTIINQFHSKVSKMILQSKVLRMTNSSSLAKIMECARNVFIQELLSVIMNSVDHIIHTVEQKHSCPQIEFQLVCKHDKIIVEPTLDEMYFTYESFLINIENIARDITLFKEFDKQIKQMQRAVIEPPSWFVEKSHKKLREVIECLFEPINVHLTNLLEQFNVICTEEAKKNMLSLTALKPNFSIFHAHVQSYNVHLERINNIAPNMYYDVGKLMQVRAKECLRSHCIEIINVLISKLVKHHINFNHSICSEFERIKGKALDIPKDAESLISLSEYISHASKVIRNELEEKVGKSIGMLSVLLQITTLSKDHIKLNKETINWLFLIEGVFQKNSTLCEAAKSELEEELQRRINALNTEVDLLFPRVSILNDMDDASRTKEYIEDYRDLIKRMNIIETEVNRINGEERLFRFPETLFPKVTEVKEIIAPFYMLLIRICQWQKDSSVWLDGPFEWLNAITITTQTLKYLEDITEMHKSFKCRIKMDVGASKCFKFSGIADDPDPMQLPAPLKLCWQALKDINELKGYLPLVSCMCNAALKERHWKEMSTIAGFDLRPHAGTTLRKIIMEKKLMEQIERYESISLGADKELALRQKLLDMINEWNRISFEMIKDDVSEKIIFKNFIEIDSLLEEHLTKIDEMKTSHFVKWIMPSVTDFSSSLAEIRSLIDQWNYAEMQRVQLNTVFLRDKSESVEREGMEREKALYLEAKEALSVVQRGITNFPTYEMSKNFSVLLKSLQEAIVKIEKTKESIKIYINNKRMSFGRFFFLSEREMHEILFESNVERIDRQVGKCFPGVKRLKINEKKCIYGIVGEFEEEVILEEKVPISAGSSEEEKWVPSLKEKIIRTLRNEIDRCISIVDFTNSESSRYAINHYPTITVVTAFKIYWSCTLQRCILSSDVSVGSCNAKCIKFLESLIEESKGPLSRSKRNTVSSLMNVVIGEIEKTKALSRREVLGEDDFEWSARLRYFWQEENVKVSLFDTTVNYEYEYSNDFSSMVDTTLTERTIHTMMQCYRYGVYGAVVGPTGTGKLETIKSLAKALGVYLYIVDGNEDGLPYERVSLIFEGAARCGGWLCFHHFHRLNLETLSVITQEIGRQVSRAASLRNEGGSKYCWPVGNISVTMDIARPTYFDLPTDLKVHFRVVSMITVDTKRIAEVKLFGGGFEESEALASKIEKTYRVLRERFLTRRGYYEFGTRSMLTVVNLALDFKRYYPEEEEAGLVVRALVDVILPMLHQEDVDALRGVLRDLYPDVSLPVPDESELIRAYESVCEKKNIVNDERLKVKVVQVFESLHLGRPLMMIGESLAGKTTIVRILRDILTEIAADREDTSSGGVSGLVRVETISPGVVKREELFGYVDEGTRLWRDGICSAAIRSFTKEDPSFAENWLIFDGPTNGSWVEDTYALLDRGDNWRMVRLTSGERVRLARRTTVIFESTDLAETSPALTSRCAIIHVDSNPFEWGPRVSSHIAERSSLYRGHEDTVYGLFDWAMDPCFHFLRQNCRSEGAAPSELQLLTGILTLFEIYLSDARAEEDREGCALKGSEGGRGRFAVWSQAALIMSVAWILGGSLPCDDRIKFNSFCVSLWNGTNESFPRPEILRSYEIGLPAEGSMEDYFYVFKGLGNWKHWGDSLKAERIPELPECRESRRYFVPTINTVRYGDMILRHIRHRRPVLLYGGAAVGKTSLVQYLLRSGPLVDECYSSNCFTFVSMTGDAESAQRVLLSKLRKIRRGEFGTPGNRVSLHFVDDLDITGEESMEQKAAFELIRQYICHGHWYDRKDSSKIYVRDLLFLVSVTARNVNSLSPRFLSCFNACAVAELTRGETFRIFSNMLLANLKCNLFGADVSNTVNSIANATIEIYDYVRQALLPVPERPQFCFNARDIARVIAGCGLIEKESVETKITFIRVWVHEVWRVFADRIDDNRDGGERETLFEKIKEVAKSNFKDSFEATFDHLPRFENVITAASLDSLLFGRFVEETGEARGKWYEEVGDVERYTAKVADYLDRYNRSTKKKLNVVVSSHMLMHLCRMARILVTPSGNLLILSCAGTGKRSIARLASYTQGQRLFEPTVESHCDPNAWRENLKTVLREAGSGSGSGVVFFFPEEEARTSAAWTRDVLGLLCAAEIPELFTPEERQVLVKECRVRAQRGDPNAEVSVSRVMDYFVDRCKARLHLLFSFDRATIRRRSSLLPILLKHCTVDCVESWPREALTFIASSRVRDLEIPEEAKSAAARCFVEFYKDAKAIGLRSYEETGRHVHVTSSAFLHAVQLYGILVEREQRDAAASRDKYIAGVDRLDAAAEQVEAMRTTLTRLKPQLESSARETAATMKEVESENASVERATILVKQEEEIANRKADIAGALKAECEAELAVAIPILEEAVMALNTLKPTDITLVKAMKNPPDTVKLVMAAVCVMLSVPPDRSIDSATGKKTVDYWGPSKRVLGDMNFLQNLREYDKDNIPVQVMQVIKRTYMTDRSFVPRIVAKASSAAEGLCKWVRAMVSYDEVAKVVAPKKEKLATAQNECNEAEAFLERKRQTLTELNAKLAALNESLRATLGRKLALEGQVRECTEKLKKAEALMGSLGGEKSRWAKTARNLQLRLDNLPGDAMLSSGVIAFTGPFGLARRDQLLRTRWLPFLRGTGIPCSEDYEFANAFGCTETEKEIEIDHCGLSDSRSTAENAIIVRHSQLWCLLVDSQKQANRWIMGIERRNGLSVVRPTDPDFLTTIKSNVECGTPTLIENAGETLEAALDPLLSKAVYELDGDTYLDFGRETVRYSFDFRLYVTTRLPNPNYSASVFEKLLIIDFSLPTEALREKLLDIVLSKEHPELQEKFERLRIERANDERALKQQEDNILTVLSSTETNVLEDENAVRTLDLSKNLSSVIIERQRAAKSTTEEINALRANYIPFAKHCAELFETLNSLSNLNHMYRFSFSWFFRLYIRSIESSGRSILFKKRLEYLESSFTRNLHSSICGSLFEKHKLVASFLMCAKILTSSDRATNEELKYFLSLPESLDHGNEAKKIEKEEDEDPPPVRWMSSATWRNVRALGTALPAFRGLLDELEAGDDSSTPWRMYFECSWKSVDPLPKKWRSRLTEFQRVILAGVARRDKLVIEVMRLIESAMGNFISDYSGQARVSRSYVESTRCSPLLFVLPSYSSPLALLSSFATATGCSSKLRVLSMGKRTEERAENVVREAQREGGWVFLQNCHLVLPWLARLERIYADSDPTRVSADFRLWMSSCEDDRFPVTVLHDSVKIVCDSAFNSKHALRGIYESEPIRSKEFFEGCPGKDKAFSRLLYGLCVFHDIVTDRRQFGVQGWTFPYDFDHSDFRLSIEQLRNVMNRYERTPFPVLLYLVGKCNYGGRILIEIEQTRLDHLLDLHCNAAISEGLIEEPRYSHSVLPRKTEYRDVLRHIDELPLDLPCEFYRTDENAIYVRDLELAAEFDDCLMSIARRFPSSEGELYRGETSQEEILRRIDDIDDQLPDDASEIFRAFEADLMEDRSDDGRSKVRRFYLEPLENHLREEIGTLDRFLKEMKRSIREVKEAFDGLGPLNDSLWSVARDILEGRVPRAWTDPSADTVASRLPSYVATLSARVRFLKGCFPRSNLRRLFPIDALAHRRMLLSALETSLARKYGIPLESIESHISVTVTADFSPFSDREDSFFLNGFHLAGAQWDLEGMTLVDSSPKIFSHRMPLLRFRVTPSSCERSECTHMQIYECPVYNAFLRERARDGEYDDVSKYINNYLLTVPLPTNFLRSHWLERGTAIFCQIEYASSC